MRQVSAIAVVIIVLATVSTTVAGVCQPQAGRIVCFSIHQSQGGDELILVVSQNDVSLAISPSEKIARDHGVFISVDGRVSERLKAPMVSKNIHSALFSQLLSAQSIVVKYETASEHRLVHYRHENLDLLRQYTALMAERLRAVEEAERLLIFW